ncbi:MAG: bifunctional diaminohydroxyphosphoribosylaminopyrimidine deaminase/5-amino-6-(5-phosphoribosylamino)uracil reductase RibD [Bacteroidetes bacterium]|nr:bifunctional diaminohydroxyphosphoribosylaminopyrimidine deaminase/5-amino-6-(5-phosphoribosylamino)uracil reductase RibD [Bacteroidota bacterium]MBK9425353.1 bifunctional diaminohydroxyphosphoribosylaminopyrimidine deaminase/5-amino-6-(5-phosphoribosylamino)uracil reductase RibD [Bacteroidota bacterium]
MSHEFYMQRCFQLASFGEGLVAPNPLVGAVLVHKGEIVSEGFHHQFGGPHAEVAALQNMHDTELLKKSVLYVNLEPCSHFGKTPPCTDLIIEKQIGLVVISNQDPFPQVNGSGIQKLKAAGIEVITGILDQEGKFLNRRFFNFHKVRKPWIILKWAQTNDGFIAPLPENKHERVALISNSESRTLVHHWRSQESAILIGMNTLVSDNPFLNSRMVNGKNPVKIVLGNHRQLPADLNIFQDKNTPVLIYNFSVTEKNENAEWIKLEKNDQVLENLLHDLYNRGLNSLIVEGGTITLSSFINTGLWNEARVFTASHKSGSGIKAPDLPHGKEIRNQVIDTDRLTCLINPENYN